MRARQQGRGARGQRLRELCRTVEVPRLELEVHQEGRGGEGEVGLVDLEQLQGALALGPSLLDGSAAATAGVGEVDEDRRLQGLQPVLLAQLPRLAVELVGLHVGGQAQGSGVLEGPHLPLDVTEVVIDAGGLGIEGTGLHVGAELLHEDPRGLHRAGVPDLALGEEGREDEAAAQGLLALAGVEQHADPQQPGGEAVGQGVRHVGEAVDVAVALDPGLFPTVGRADRDGEGHAHVHNVAILAERGG